MDLCGDLMVSLNFVGLVFWLFLWSCFWVALRGLSVLVAWVFCLWKLVFWRCCVWLLRLCGMMFGFGFGCIFGFAVGVRLFGFCYGLSVFGIS